MKKQIPLSTQSGQSHGWRSGTGKARGQASAFLSSIRWGVESPRSQDRSMRGFNNILKYSSVFGLHILLTKHLLGSGKIVCHWESLFFINLVMDQLCAHEASFFLSFDFLTELEDELLLLEDEERLFFDLLLCFFTFLNYNYFTFSFSHLKMMRMKMNLMI